MSLVDTDAIWLALGDFYDLFPDDERIYWETFWDAYGDVVSDVWGLAFQVDRAKSLFSTSPTFERRSVLVKISDLVQSQEARFRISGLKLNSSGQWILRGFVPRDLRIAKTLPQQGVIRIGTDILEYQSVNTVGDDFIREATFVISGDIPHDYTDNPDFNDDFIDQPIDLDLRIEHAAGETTIDAVRNGAVVNESGSITLSGETVDYSSVTVLADSLVFSLVSPLQFSYPLNDQITVHRRDLQRWSQSLDGDCYIVGNNSIRVMATDNATATLIGQYQLRDAIDFDVSVTIKPDTWPDPAPGTMRRTFGQLKIGPDAYNIGIRTENNLGTVKHFIVTDDVETELDTIVSFDARFKRVGSSLELQFRPLEDSQYQVLNIKTVKNLRSTINLVVDSEDGVSQVIFDEVIRRAGEIVGNTRLEEYFSATETYAYTYDIDQNITSAPDLSDRPQQRTVTMTTISESDGFTIEATSEEEPPEAGFVVIENYTAIYDEYTTTNGVYTLQIRNKLDPDITPLASGTTISAITRSLREGIDYSLSGDGKMSMKELPTRDRMWAPVVQVDAQHIQKTFGKILDLSSDISTQTYLNRVRGTWFSLMSGPSIRNMHTGLQLSMGLPVAKNNGTVTGIRDYFDELGRLEKRELTILGENGYVDHELSTNLYPYIDWTVEVGETVDEFQPLTNGVTIDDIHSDNEWYTKFSGVGELEKFNGFGISVALESITADASVEDAMRFINRVKPTYTKMAMHLLLTSGNEDMSDEVQDNLTVAQLPHLCEDMTLPEGDPNYENIFLGGVYKLGQGYTLGDLWSWKPETIGIYKNQGPWTDGETIKDYDYIETGATSDGSTVDGSNVFTTAGGREFQYQDVGKKLVVNGSSYEILEYLSTTEVRVDNIFDTTEGSLDWSLQIPGVFKGSGGYSAVEVEAPGDGLVIADDNLFSTAGAHSFSEDDVGKTLVITSGSETGGYEITQVIDTSTIRLNHTFANGAASLDWILRTLMFVDSDVGKNVHVNGLDYKITEILGQNTVRLLTVFSTTEEDLEWELRDYKTLGEDHALGEVRAYRCLLPSDNEPSEVVDAQQVVTVAVGA